MFSRYIPPLLWGKSGHLQTALYGKLGRVSSPNPSGVRMYLPMVDGATATFDLFEPMGNHQTGGDYLCGVYVLLDDFVFLPGQRCRYGVGWKRFMNYLTAK